MYILHKLCKLDSHSLEHTAVYYQIRQTLCHTRRDD